MPSDLTLSCRCGAVRGTVRAVAPRTGTHLVCHCRDCRAAARHLGYDDALDEGGTPIFQTMADRVAIEDKGAMGCLRLRPRSLLRWHCRACGTPLANTPARPGLCFAGLPVMALTAGDGSAPTDSLGPVRGRYFLDRHEPNFARLVGERGRTLPVIAAALIFMARGRLTGGWRRQPFFDADGRPVARPRVLTDADRDRAYA